MWLNILIIYLVVPTHDAQIPSSSLWGVETDCISCVIEVNSYSLRDTSQQLLVWCAGVKPKIPADHLRIRKTHVNDHRTNSWLYVQRDDNGKAQITISICKQEELYPYKDVPYAPVLLKQSRCENPQCSVFWDHLICMWNWVKWNSTGVGFISIKAGTK